LKRTVTLRDDAVRNDRFAERGRGSMEDVVRRLGLLEKNVSIIKTEIAEVRTEIAKGTASHIQ
jgi:hypothetical protein